jgi:hypothetical protein
MSSSFASRKHHPAPPPADASVRAAASADTGDNLLRFARAKATTPVESRAFTYEERRDEWRRQAGTPRWSTSGAPEPEGVPAADTWRGLHP